MELVPATAALLRAELTVPSELARLLAGTVPPQWPPPLYERPHIQWAFEQLQRDPSLTGWLAWFWLKRPEQPGHPSTLVGLGGFKGKPDPHGAVEMGYSILPPFQRLGLGTEAVNALSIWALEDPRVSRVFAETLPELPASIRVLQKCGFEFVGNGSDIEVLRFERKRSPK
jgi:RimJ/RimL family protein N-acetyltransferase